MLRKTLLATTALVLCASLSLAGQNGVLPKGSKAMAKLFARVHVGHAVNGIPVTVTTSRKGAHPAHNVAPNLETAIFSNYSKDANAQFISWYGYMASNGSACYSSSHGYHSCLRITIDNALAFTPAATVTTKKVTVPVFAYYASAQFEVDIYSSVGGFPGNVIAHSKKFTASDNALCCTSTTVPIKANLSGGTQYFIGVVGVNDQGGWEMEDTDLSGAAIDYTLDRESGTYGSTANQQYSWSNSGSWHESTYQPETGAVILK